MMSRVEDATRTGLHAVAESMLAGPQLVRSGTIRLRVLQGGFGTVAEPVLRVAGADLVRADGTRVPLRGTLAQVAETAGVALTVPDIYPDHATLGPDDPLEVDPLGAAHLAAWFERGRQALVALAPARTPVLWPEHFDLAVDVGDVGYGVSPGDGFSAAPYAYVSPPAPDPASPFWNAPFGALRTISELPTPDAVLHFFRTGREAAARLGAAGT
jgi:hypothetical protein